MKKLCLITIMLCLFLNGPGCKKAKEETATTTVKKVEKRVKKKIQIPVKLESEEAKIKIVDQSDHVIGIDLVNNVPVRIIQFIITGVKIIKVRMTSRTEGFYANHNARNGKVVMLSPSDKTIAPGSGLIAEIVCDKVGSANLSGIKIVH